MKKVLFSIVLVFCTLLSAYAVPSGRYVDDSGRKKVDVTNYGAIYLYDDNGNVKTEYLVTEEKSDGSFVIKVVAINGQQYDGPTFYQNAYFRENGKLYLNLQPITSLWGSLHLED